MILSGDHSDAVAHVGDRLEIETRGGLLPEEKMQTISELRDEGGRIAMVGDGINDTPALAAADVGIAMRCGADITRDSADVCLLSDRLDHLTFAVDLAKQTMETVRQNLFWAFAYNVVGVGLAMAGFLSPIFAAFAMALSSLIVIGNSLRLLDYQASSSNVDRINPPSMPESSSNELASPPHQRELMVSS